MTSSRRYTSRHRDVSPSTTIFVGSWSGVIGGPHEGYGASLRARIANCASESAKRREDHVDARRRPSEPVREGCHRVVSATWRGDQPPSTRCAHVPAAKEGAWSCRRDHESRVCMPSCRVGKPSGRVGMVSGENRQAIHFVRNLSRERHKAPRLHVLGGGIDRQAVEARRGYDRCRVASRSFRSRRSCCEVEGLAQNEGGDRPSIGNREERAGPVRSSSST